MIATFTVPTRCGLEIHAVTTVDSSQTPRVAAVEGSGRRWVAFACYGELRRLGTFKTRKEAKACALDYADAAGRRLLAHQVAARVQEAA